MRTRNRLSNLDSNNTIATLCNIGNSCYLNSVIYTLRFAPRFLHKLHHLIEHMATISASEEIPRSNRLIVTEKLHELYQNLHRNETKLNSEPLHAGTFLQAIQDVCSIFEGNQQQDAHECLMCILDSIRETCDTLVTAIIYKHEQLLSEYGYGSLIEESKDELAPSGTTTNSNAANNSINVATTNSSSSSISSMKATKSLSRKPKRKKQKNSGDELVPDLPTKDVKSKDSGACGDLDKPLSSTEIKNNTRNMILKALADDNDVNGLKKLKETVCKLLGLNFFCEDFEGVTVSSIKCLSCDTVRKCEEKMIDVSLPITAYKNSDSMSDPQQFFQDSFITKEYFRDDNKYRCEECSGYTEAIRSITYDVLPRLLVIHLKRFSDGMKKINSYIPTPFSLHCFCNRCLELPDDEKLHTYKLYSVITHLGARMSVGHYVAYTCSLDIQSEYRFCPNEITKLLPSNLQGTNSQNSDTDKNASRSGNGPGTSQNNNGNSNQAGDKNARSSKRKNGITKGVNDLVNKVVTYGIENLTLNSGLSGNGACQGSKCCGIHVQNSKLMSSNTSNGNFVSNSNEHVNNETLSPPAISKPSSSNLSIASTSSSNTGLTSIHIDDVNGCNRRNYVSKINQQWWYMCDDDKIEVMNQKQFEKQLLKKLITPYLLFYARYDQNNS